MIFNFPELYGNQVILTKATPDHVQSLYRAGNFPEIWTFMLYSISSVEDAEKIINDAIESMVKNNKFMYVIISKQSNEVIGSTSLFAFSETDKHLEIGSTWFTPSVWGTKVNTECKYLLLKHCFETLKLNRVQLKTDGRNKRSQRAIEKLGATKEGILRKHFVLPDGYVRDTVMYSIINEEWHSVKGKLENGIY